eukprot:7800667-Alexandrium_andersonii.AAC.1
MRRRSASTSAPHRTWPLGLRRPCRRLRPRAAASRVAGCTSAAKSAARCPVALQLGPTRTARAATR